MISCRLRPPSLLGFHMSLLGRVPYLQYRALWLVAGTVPQFTVVALWYMLITLSVLIGKKLGDHLFWITGISDCK